LHELAV